MYIEWDDRRIFIDDIIAKRIPKWKRQVLKHDRDKVILIDGREGSGKSVLAQQLAFAIDEDFNINKIAFNGEQLIEKIHNLDKKVNRKKGDCFILDEAFGAISSRQAMSSINRTMVKLGTEMRMYNLFVIVVLPYFFDMDKYYAIARSDFLIHVKFDKKGYRGYYQLFPYNKKKLLYIKGKKEYSYSVVKSPLPTCRFRDGYIVDKEEYNQLKEAGTKQNEKNNVTKREYVLNERVSKLINWIKDNYGLTDNEIADIINVDRSNVTRMRNAPILCAVHRGE